MKDISQLYKDLEKMELRLEKELVVAQRKTAIKILQDAKELAPGNGGYKKSIYITPTQRNDEKIITGVVTSATVTTKSNGNSYNLGFLLENGTKPHIILPVDASVLHFEINGEDIFAKIVHHPGFTAREHFKPALNRNKKLYKEEIAKAIERSMHG